MVVAPLVAVSVIVSPEFPPLAETVGVVSLVTLSVDELPVSDDARRSGAAGADGVPTIVSPSEGPADETLPAASVNVALVVHEPGVNVDRSHDCVPVPIVYVQLTVVEPFVALMVANSPLLPPLRSDIVGVVSVVTLSDVDEPVSEPVARSSAPGADGEVVSTFTLRPAEAADVWPDAV